METLVNQQHTATQQKEQFLTEQQINAIARKINQKIDLPIVKEGGEFKIFVKIVRKIDHELYHLLPNEIGEMLRDAQDGIDKEEAQEIKRRLTPMINKKINIPIISERKEAKLIDFVLDIIFEALEPNKKLEEM